MKKFLLILVGSSLSLVGCNSGTNNSAGSNAQPSAGLEAVGNYVTHFKGNHQRVSSAHMAGTEPVVFNEAIGWDSKLNRFAPNNCYIYTSQLTKAQAIGNQTMAASSSSVKDSLGIDVSVSAKYGAFSTHDSAAVAMSATSSAQAVQDLINYGITGVIAVNVSGFSDPAYQELYLNNPSEFAAECGDKILTSIPVKIQVVAGLNAATHDSSFNSTENAKLDGSYGFNSVAVDISSEQSKENNSFKATSRYLSYGQIDATESANVLSALSACAASLTSSGCVAVSTAVGNAVNNAWDAAFAAINAKEGSTSPVWMEYVAVDDSQITSKSGEEVSEVVSTFQPSIESRVTISPYEKYITQINNNVNLLYDLTIAANIFNSAAFTVAYKSAYEKSNMGLYTETDDDTLNTALFSQLFTGGIANYAAMVNLCINNSPTAADVEKNCSVLPTNPSLETVVNSYVTFDSTVNAKDYHQAIIATVRGLIYDDTMLHSAIYLGAIGEGFKSGVAYRVWLPNTHNGLSLLTFAIGNYDGDAPYIYINTASKSMDLLQANWFYDNSLVTNVYGKDGNNNPLAVKAGNSYSGINEVSFVPSGNSCKPFGSLPGCQFDDYFATNNGAGYWRVGDYSQRVDWQTPVADFESIYNKYSIADYVVSKASYSKWQGGVATNYNLFYTLYPWAN